MLSSAPRVLHQSLSKPISSPKQNPWIGFDSSFPSSSSPQTPGTAMKGAESDVMGLLLRERIVFLGNNIEDFMADAIISHLLLLDALDPTKDIRLFINSPGGSLRNHTLDGTKLGILSKGVGWYLGALSLVLLSKLSFVSSKQKSCYDSNQPTPTPTPTSHILCMISKKTTTTHLQTEMAEIPNPTCEIGESKMVLSDQERSANVVLDIESLALFTDKNKELASSPRSTYQRSLSRKGSYRVLKKISERETVETPKQASSSKGTGLNSTPEKCVMVPVTTQLLNSNENSNAEDTIKESLGLTLERSFSFLLPCESLHLLFLFFSKIGPKANPSLKFGAKVGISKH